LVPPSGIQKGTIGIPETSVKNCYYSLRNNPEERSSHLLRSAITHVSGPLNALINISYLGKLYDGDEVKEKLGESHSTLVGVTTCTKCGKICRQKAACKMWAQTDGYSGKLNKEYF
jgi:hypothetical protein